jgi:hypothetical protein
MFAQVSWSCSKFCGPCPARPYAHSIHKVYTKVKPYFQPLQSFWAGPGRLWPSLGLSVCVGLRFPPPEPKARPNAARNAGRYWPFCFGFGCMYCGYSPCFVFLCPCLSYGLSLRECHRCYSLRFPFFSSVFLYGPTGR